MIRRTVTDVSEGGELMTLQTAKDELGIVDTGAPALDAITDAQVTAKLAVVRKWCESQSYKTYTIGATTRILELDRWPNSEIKLDAPPLLGVTSVEYYDDANSLQTLADTQYEVLKPSAGRGRIVWGDTFDRPSIYPRADAIKVTYTCGYATAVPPLVLEAAKLMLSFFWDNNQPDAVLAIYERSAISLMRSEDWGGYA